MATHTGSIRRGLPRVPGGEPWPPAGEAPERAGAAQDAAAAEPAAVAAAPAVAEQVAPPPAAPSSSVAPAASTPGTTTAGTTALRRGLPRVPGGEPWPPAGFAPAAAAAPVTPSAIAAVAAEAPAVTEVPAEVSREAPTVTKAPAKARVETQAGPAVPAVAAAEAPAVVREAPPARTAVVPPEPAAAKATATEAPAKAGPQAKLYGSRTLGRWIRLAILLSVAAVAAAGILVLAARGVTTLPGVPAFLERYPGTYGLPAGAEPGFPWWAQWTHFFNIFLMVLIIRSGYQVRTQQKPPAFWTPRRGGKKISITLWLHQSLDLLWLANGLIFVVLLFASGRWMRIVPTSWEVFPNALSALLQYMTLDWPVESGWVNYNSLQQLMYFIVVFVAAPVAAVTGARMSELWPKDAKALNKAYPVEAARALHFPTMLFFVLFILIHVFLVLATGALRNLNHMFGGTDVVNWTGFWLFAAAIAVTAGGWFAARPIVLAPIAKLSGSVSSR